MENDERLIAGGGKMMQCCQRDSHQISAVVPVGSPCICCTQITNWSSMCVDSNKWSTVRWVPCALCSLAGANYPGFPHM